MTKLEEKAIVIAAIKASLSGRMSDAESCEVAKAVTAVDLDRYDVEEMTDIHDVICNETRRSNTAVTAIQAHVWGRVADKIAYRIQKLNEPSSYKKRNVVVNNARGS